LTIHRKSQKSAVSEPTQFSVRLCAGPRAPPAIMKKLIPSCSSLLALALLGSAAQSPAPPKAKPLPAVVQNAVKEAELATLRLTQAEQRLASLRRAARKKSQFAPVCREVIVPCPKGETPSLLPSLRPRRTICSNGPTRPSRMVRLRSEGPARSCPQALERSKSSRRRGRSVGRWRRDGAIRIAEKSLRSPSRRPSWARLWPRL